MENIREQLLVPGIERQSQAISIPDIIEALTIKEPKLIENLQTIAIFIDRIEKSNAKPKPTYIKFFDEILDNWENFFYSYRSYVSKLDRLYTQLKSIKKKTEDVDNLIKAIKNILSWCRAQQDSQYNSENGAAIQGVSISPGVRRSHSRSIN